MKYLKVLLLLIMTLPVVSQAYGFEKDFGVRLGYVTRNKSASAGLFFEYSFTNHFEIAPSATILFRNNNLDGVALDLDVHFPLWSGVIKPYPIVGIGYSSWGQHIDSSVSKDVTSHYNRFGLNAGGGVSMHLGTSIKVNIEAKYRWMKKYPTGLISVGVGYIF